MPIDAYYSRITDTNADLQLLEPGAQTGDIRNHDGKFYVLVKATAVAIADGCALMQPTGLTTTGVTTELTVAVTTGVAVPVIGANNTGKVITASHYFWAIQYGAGYGIGGGTIGDGVKFSPAAAGAIGATADGLDTICGVTISDVTTTVANRVFWNLPAGGTFDLA